MTVRFKTCWATREDAHAVGMLALDGLEDAPSSEVGLEDVYPDPREFGEQLLAGSASVYLATTAVGPVGALRIVPREFLRAAHVAEVALLISQQSRGQGVGARLLDAAVGQLNEDGRFAKLVMRVASDDLGLSALLRHCESTWTRERVERVALCREGRVLDMHLYAHIFDLSG